MRIACWSQSPVYVSGVERIRIVVERGSEYSQGRTRWEKMVVGGVRASEPIRSDQSQLSWSRSDSLETEGANDPADVRENALPRNGIPAEEKQRCQQQSGRAGRILSARTAPTSADTAPISLPDDKHRLARALGRVGSSSDSEGELGQGTISANEAEPERRSRPDRQTRGRRGGVGS